VAPLSEPPETAGEAIDPRAAAGWMRAHPEHRLALLRDEGAEDAAPAGDPAIAANLRFLADALAASSDGPLGGALARFAANLPVSLPARAEEYAAALDRQLEATLDEAGRQFGPGVADDPELRPTLERRARLGAWREVFVSCLADHLDDGSALAPAAAAWMAARQDKLASAIFALDKRAKQAAIAQDGPDAVDDIDLVNRIGQAAVVQGHVLFLLEALAATLPSGTGPGSAVR